MCVSCRGFLGDLFLLEIYDFAKPQTSEVYKENVWYLFSFTFTAWPNTHFCLFPFYIRNPILGFQNFRRRLILPKIEKSWRFVKSFVHLFSLCMCVCEGRSFGLNSLEFLSLILFHPLAHFITVLTARIESPTRKELKTHKTFHSPTQSRLSIQRAWPDWNLSFGQIKKKSSKKSIT